MGIFKTAVSKPQDSVPSIFGEIHQKGRRIYASSATVTEAEYFGTNDKIVGFLALQPTPANTKQLFTTSRAKSIELNNGHPILKEPQTGICNRRVNKELLSCRSQEYGYTTLHKFAKFLRYASKA